MISLVTNIDSLVAQQNLNVNSQFQSNTIQQLTSGYRINTSADDAAGLAVANGYRDLIAQLNQGVLNGNQGVSQLQIVDGGLSNISQILDRMQTLATESASSTFAGNRATLNNEYSSLMSEIDRQAANIGLSSGGNYNTVLNTYIGGGGASQTNSQVTVDLSGNGNVVTSTGLGLSGTSLLAGGVDVGTVNTNASSTFLASNHTQVVTLNLADGNQHQVTIQGSASGISAQDAINQINQAFSSYGVSASIDSSNGFIQFGGNVGFTVSAAAPSAGTDGAFATAGTDAGENTGMYRISSNTAGTTNAPQLTYGWANAADTETLTFASGGQSVTVTLNGTNQATVGEAQTYLNQQLASLGISAVVNEAGSGLNFYSANPFTIADAGATAATDGVFGVQAGFASESATAPAAGGSSTSNALAAITAVTNAVQALGLVQGRVGAGENKMNYAINLAQSQITSFSSAQSQIRDANVAAEAANLTKAQVLQQASIAAMAQANAEPQAVLALLKT